jgi:hypothetical protein
VTSKKLSGTNDINGWWQIFNHTSIAVGEITNQPGSRYRVELLTVLTVIRILLQAQDSTSIPEIPTCVTFEVRQKRIILWVFTNSPIGLKDAVQANYDVILEIRRLLSQCHYKVIPVHNTSNQTSVISADGVSEADPIIVPHTITILHRGNKILEGLECIMSHEHHFSVLQGKLMKDNLWNIHQFQSVAWDD